MRRKDKVFNMQLSHKEVELHVPEPITIKVPVAWNKRKINEGDELILEKLTSASSSSKPKGLPQTMLTVDRADGPLAKRQKS